MQDKLLFKEQKLVGGSRFCAKPKQYLDVDIMPIITVVTVVFNSRRHLRQTIESVLCQSYCNVEYIVIDGGSSDGSLDIIREYEDCIDVWISEQDTGIYNAMNKSLEYATGEWVHFLNSDDFFMDVNVLKNVAAMINENSNDHVFFYGDVHLIDDSGNLVKIISSSSESLREKLPIELPISHQGVFMSRVSLNEMNGFDEGFRIASDYDLILRVSKETKFAQLEHLGIAYARLGGVSTDAKNAIRLLMEYRSSQFKNGYILPSSKWLVEILYWLSCTTIFKLVGEDKLRNIKRVLKTLLKR